MEPWCMCHSARASSGSSVRLPPFTVAMTAMFTCVPTRQSVTTHCCAMTWEADWAMAGSSTKELLMLRHLPCFTCNLMASTDAR
jgi:hypothetical protein